MEYRRLPCGTERERFSGLGPGTGSLGDASEDETEAVIRTAMEHGIDWELEQLLKGGILDMILKR